MRYFIFLLAILVGMPFSAQALWNDSDAVHFPGDDSSYIGSGDTGGSSDNTGGTGSSGSGGSSAPSDGASAPEAGSSGQEGGSGVDASGEIIYTSGGGDSSESDTQGTVQDLFDLLAGDGGIGLGMEDDFSAWSDTGDQTSADSGDGVGDNSATGGASGTKGGVSVDGDAVRAALAGNSAARTALRTLNAGASVIHFRAGTRLTDADLGLIAASTAVKDAHLASVAIAAGQFDIAYQLHGELLAFIPINFRARIHVSPDAAEQSSRVTIKYPWYQALVRKHFSKADIARTVDAALIADQVSAGGEDQRAREARLLIAITDTLATHYSTE